MEIDNTILLVIDVQGRLVTLMHEHDRLFANIERMIKVAQALKMPIICTEQAPDKIGRTVEAVSQLLFPVIKPIAKRSFSAFACPAFREQLEQSGRRRILIIGIETHVCVYQTARDLHRHGYHVEVIADAVSSRLPLNKEIALNRLRDHGVVITSSELAICELIESADHPQFREVMANIKR